MLYVGQVDIAAGAVFSGLRQALTSHNTVTETLGVEITPASYSWHLQVLCR